MSLLDLNLEALAACPLPSLDGFDFDAVLEPSLSNTPDLPQNYMSLVQSIEKASQEGNLSEVKQALDMLRLSQGGQRDTHTGRALLLAIQHQHRDIVAYLLSEGIDPSSDAIKKATLTKNRAILQLLFENAWEINKELGWDDPPALAYAVEDADLTAWFLSQGADPNASCFTDKTPLSAAVQYAPYSVIELLFAHGGNIQQGQLLHSAISRKLNDRKTILEFLIREKGALVNSILYSNRPETYAVREAFGLGTPLHEAAARGDGDAVRILLDHGARIDIRDSCGDTAVDRAESNGYGDVVLYLRERAGTG